MIVGHDCFVFEEEIIHCQVQINFICAICVVEICAQNSFCIKIANEVRVFIEHNCSDEVVKSLSVLFGFDADCSIYFVLCIKHNDIDFELCSFFWF